MSELKRPSVLQLRHNNSDGFVYAYEVDDMDKYLSKVDKVIAEKDSKIVELKKQVHDYTLGLFVIQATAEKELRHQKYKRCEAMARWCDDRYDDAFERVLSVRDMGFEPSDELTFDLAFFRKWRECWLELAEKFKEAK